MHCCLWFRSVFRVRGPWPKRYGYHLSIIYIYIIIYDIKPEILFYEKGKSCSGEIQTDTAYEADALPTELPRQLSCLSQIKAIRGHPV